MHPQMFISITDFEMEETDNSHILITLIDSMGQPEETKKFDKTNYDFQKWIQDGLFTTEGAKNTCHPLGANFESIMTLVKKLTGLDSSNCSKSFVSKPFIIRVMSHDSIVKTP